MAGPRDPSSSEAALYTEAISTRDAELLNTIVNDLYPDIVWGSVTRRMSDEDQKWLMNNLKSPGTSDAWPEHWSQSW